MKLARDKKIVALREQGMPFALIARRFGLSESRIRAICLSYRPSALGVPPLPDSLSVITALEVDRSIGLWPNEENAPEIARRLTEVLEATTRRKTIRELGAWLQSLKLFP
ncbi:DNA invertase Pin-like site-specific DNA recombinase [Shinella sp. BE166]|uniref:hypothetical protein n=1 Tax=Shinella sp. BE166 TaxID=3373918 RepID=UPI003EBABFA6